MQLTSLHGQAFVILENEFPNKVALAIESSPSIMLTANTTISIRNRGDLTLQKAILVWFYRLSI